MTDSALDKVNIARLTNYVSKMAAHGLKQFVCEDASEKSAQNAEKVTNDILSSLVTNGTLSGSSAKCHLAEMTWARLYPSPLIRGLAMATAKMVNWKWLQTRHECWYHHILPFSINHEVIFNGDVESMISIKDDELSISDYISNHSFINTVISIKVPYKYIDTIISITPKQKAEYIFINIALH